LTDNGKLGELRLEKLGPYDLLEVIGRGGMGSVYRARNRETGEIHAVKSLLDNFSDNQHFRNRFESEIRALIKLDHPNIVRIISFGQEMGTMYFAMELVQGASLFQLQKKRHRFDWREILAIARQVARGLRHAHDRGIVHRDLKPGNLLMPIDENGKHGEVKLTDFGIAKRFGASQNTGDNLIGTMDFMSPEQAKGQPATARSDLYSLGTVLYTLLAGKPPFTSNSFEESLKKLTRVPAPPITELVANIPESVDGLLQKLMVKDPEKRIQTAQALLFKLDEIEQELIETSQAKTRVPIEANKLEETFEIVDVKQDVTHPNTERAEKPARKGGSLVSEGPRPSRKPSPMEATVASRVQSSSEDTEGKKQSIDFHNTVSDHVRTAEYHASAESSRGLWWLFAAFVGVIALVAWGLFQASRPRPADELFAKLESSRKNSLQVVELASEFLNHYPQDPRAEKVKQLQKSAQDERRYNGILNQLIAREKLSGANRLSEIEQQLTQIYNVYGADKDMAAAKLAALVTVHSGDKDLSESDQLCLETAEYFQNTLRREAREELVTKLQFIRRTVEANKSETDPRVQADQYRSLVDLYGDEDWDDSPEGRAAAELMNFVKSNLPK
jgi:serine/threonine-protein kinase